MRHVPSGQRASELHDRARGQLRIGQRIGQAAHAGGGNAVPAPHLLR